MPVGAYPSESEVCNGQSYGTNPFTIVAPSASANTKGSYVQITAATTSDMQWIEVIAAMKGGSSDQSSMSFDIAIGGGGVEKIVIADFVLDDSASSFPTALRRIGFPIFIPAGTRIAARSQCNKASGGSNCGVRITGFDAPSIKDPLNACDALGFLSASTLGTAITAGTSSAKGSYAQLIASTSRDYSGIAIIVDQHGTSGNFDSLWVDIAIGAAASEKVIVPDRLVLAYGGPANERSSPFIPIRIPSGTRISARAASDGGTASSIGVTVYGVY